MNQVSIWESHARLDRDYEEKGQVVHSEQLEGWSCNAQTGKTVSRGGGGHNSSSILDRNMEREWAAEKGSQPCHYLAK